MILYRSKFLKDQQEVKKKKTDSNGNNSLARNCGVVSLIKITQMPQPKGALLYLQWIIDCGNYYGRNICALSLSCHFLFFLL